MAVRVDQQHNDGSVQIIVGGCVVAALVIGILSVLLILCRKKLISSLSKKWKNGSNSMPQPNDSRGVIVNPSYKHTGDSCCDFELETSTENVYTSLDDTGASVSPKQASWSLETCDEPQLYDHLGTVAGRDSDCTSDAAAGENEICTDPEQSSHCVAEDDTYNHLHMMCSLSQDQVDRTSPSVPPPTPENQFSIDADNEQNDTYSYLARPSGSLLESAGGGPAENSTTAAEEPVYTLSTGVDATDERTVHRHPATYLSGDTHLGNSGGAASIRPVSSLSTSIESTGCDESPLYDVCTGPNESSTQLHNRTADEVFISDVIISGLTEPDCSLAFAEESCALYDICADHPTSQSDESRQPTGTLADSDQLVDTDAIKPIGSHIQVSSGNTNTNSLAIISGTGNVLPLPNGIKLTSSLTVGTNGSSPDEDACMYCAVDGTDDIIYDDLQCDNEGHDESTATENSYDSVFGNHTAHTPSERLETGRRGCCLGSHATAGNHSPGSKKSTSLHDASLYDNVAV